MATTVEDEEDDGESSGDMGSGDEDGSGDMGSGEQEEEEVLDWCEEGETPHDYEVR